MEFVGELKHENTKKCKHCAAEQPNGHPRTSHGLNTDQTRKERKRRSQMAFIRVPSVFNPWLSLKFSQACKHVSCFRFFVLELGLPTAVGSLAARARYDL